MQTDGRWVMERDVPNVIARVVELKHASWGRGREVYVRSLPGSRIAYRVVSEDEKPFDRPPLADGIADADLVPPRRGRTSLYPWSEWLDGRWHLARAGQEYASSAVSFSAVLRNRASLLGLRASIRTLPGGPANPYGDSECVAFCFLAAGEQTTLWDAEQQLAKYRRQDS